MYEDLIRTGNNFMKYLLDKHITKKHKNSNNSFKPPKTDAENFWEMTSKWNYIDTAQKLWENILTHIEL